MAMDGLAIGPRTSPMMAEMASRLRMADRNFILEWCYMWCLNSTKDAKCSNGYHTRKSQRAKRNQESGRNQAPLFAPIQSIRIGGRFKVGTPHICGIWLRRMHIELGGKND
jgi:hypothetical protein